MPEIYVSTDIETDGPIPSPHSMLSLGSAAYLADKTLLGTFEANLESLESAQSHPDTLNWWKAQPKALKPRREEIAMRSHLSWLKGLPCKPVFVAYPTGFNFSFVLSCLIKFTGESPFSQSTLDIKTLAMAMMNSNYRDATKQGMPRRWFDILPHDHIAVNDAISQGALFCNMLKELKQDTP